jgi:NDP-hexose-3-ketoreductase
MKNSPIINIGILGCASIADRSVIPAILNLPNNFNLIAIASRSQEKSDRWAAKFNCKGYNKYEDLLADESIDAIYLPLPTGLHFEWISKALKAGKHIYAEKSFSNNLSQTITLIEKAKKHKLTLFEGYMFQYHSQHNQVKKIIEKGTIGEIRHFSSKFGFPPLDPTNFRYNPILGGGALLDAAGYTIKVTRLILGDDMKIKASTLKFKNANSQNEINVYGSAFMSNNRGIGASLAFGFDNYYQCNYEIWGTKGKIMVERAFTPKPEQKPTILVDKNNIQQQIELEADNHFEKALIEFYDVIKSETKRNSQYKEIYLQSEAQDEILAHSKKN